MGSHNLCFEMQYFTYDRRKKYFVSHFKFFFLFGVTETVFYVKMKRGVYFQQQYSSESSLAFYLFTFIIVYLFCFFLDFGISISFVPVVPNIKLKIRH